MVRKCIIGAALAICGFLLLPGAAIASTHRTTIHGVKDVYTVAAGSSLTVAGWLTSSARIGNWHAHARIEVERRVDGHWKDVREIAPTVGGHFSFRLVKLAAGTYQVHYDGCAHLSASSHPFVVKRPAPAQAKVDPLLSVDDFHLTAYSSMGDMTMVLISATVHTGRPLTLMGGTNLGGTVYGSLDGTSWTALGPGLNPAGFTTDTSVSVFTPGQIIIDTPSGPYTYLRLHVEWAGNEFTTSGTATSTVLQVQQP